MVLDTFNSGGTTGAVTAGTSWAAAGAVVQNAGSITVGGTAQNDNGWGVTSINVNGSAMTYVRVTAQRDAGNAAPSFVIQFEDPTIKTVIVSVNTSAFAAGAMSHVLLPIDWGGEFNSSAVAGWNLGGGAPPPGTASFQMTLDHLALTSGLSLAGGGTFTTVGNQTYSGAQTVSAATGLNTFGTSGNAVTFTSTVDGANALTINTPGTTTFAGAVGNTTPLASLTTDTGGTTAINGGSVVTTGAQTYNDAVSLGADTLIRSTTSGAIQFSQALVGNNHSLAIDSAGTVAFNSASGLTSLTKSGSGTMTMTGSSPYTGATLVNAGTLRLDGSATSSAFTVNSAATLSGGGSLGALTLANSGTVSPGASTGALSAANTIFSGGASYHWEINNAAGTAGTASGWDLLSISGSLTLTATSGNPFTIRLNSLAGSSAGLASGFSSSANYSFTFVTTTSGVSNFSAGAFAFDASGFQNPFSGAWSVGLSGNNLMLSYSASAVPEPGTYAAWVGGAALLVAKLRRWRSNRSSPRTSAQ